MAWADRILMRGSYPSLPVGVRTVPYTPPQTNDFSCTMDAKKKASVAKQVQHDGGEWRGGPCFTAPTSKLDELRIISLTDGKRLIPATRPSMNRLTHPHAPPPNHSHLAVAFCVLAFQKIWILLIVQRSKLVQ